VRGLRPVPALLHVIPLVVAAALSSPACGSLLDRHGARAVILGGLAVMGAGCGILAMLQPETPYPVIAGGLVLIGAGNIAVVTSVTAIVLGSLPPERSGSAAALNNAAVQVGGALGAATLTGAFLDAARAEYFSRLAPTGMATEKLREITKAWRDAVRESTSSGARILPEGMEQQFEEAYRVAFTAGVAHVFLIAAVLAAAAAVLAWFGLDRSPSAQGPAQAA
jgi:DHA2 family multidrug resistance protein-like MFS transporter